MRLCQGAVTHQSLVEVSVTKTFNPWNHVIADCFLPKILIASLTGRTLTWEKRVWYVKSPFLYAYSAAGHLTKCEYKLDVF